MADDFQFSEPEQPRQWVDRRKKPDWIVRSVTVIAIIGWIGAMIALVLYYIGAPEGGNLGSSLDTINPNIGAGGAKDFNPELLAGSFIAIMASFIACVVGFILNVTRKRRKTDKYNKLVITLGMVSIIFIVVFLINYAQLLL